MDEEYKKSNREKALSPRRGKYWCDTCDRCFLGVGEKCPLCGARSIKRRLKKETNAQ